MHGVTGPLFPAAALLWPALWAESASEFASLLAREMVNLAIGSAGEPDRPEPSWTTRNAIVLELDSVRLRDFSTSQEGAATLICAPYALHGSTITDFAPGHSLIAALQKAGLRRLFVTDWRSATPEMRFRNIDDYLADLNILVDQLGGKVDLVGLCQGGWLALTYAARLPAKVRKLVLAGAPIDIAAGRSAISELARSTPASTFKELVGIGDGRVLGQLVQHFWGQGSLGAEDIHRLLQSSEPVGSPAFRDLEARFREWQAWTVDLPGTYYLQVVEQLFKENRLAEGRFVALGRRVELASVRCPVFLLAASEDEIVAPEQLFATGSLIDQHRCRVRKLTAPSTHLGLFLGRTVLSEAWPRIALGLARGGRRAG
jgi:poly(3-hydroxyalkanoate) synthetase